MMDPTSLIHRYLMGDVTEEEARELDRLLAEDPELRHEFVLAAATETGLREVAFERTVEPVRPRTRGSSSRRIWWVSLLTVAAAIALMFSWIPGLIGSDTVATIASSENAAWESSLPTTPGSQLIPGSLSLRTGVATIQFHSGAEVLLEAPADLELVTPMRGRLLSGAAVIDVPDGAIGFVMETPDGYAVDFGTRFAVRVDQDEKQSDFEIIDGEIAVHHPESGENVRLIGRGKKATVSSQSLVLADLEADEEEETIEPPSRVVRIGTNERTGSVVRNNKRKKFVDREILSVKTTNRGKWDHRSFFAFDLSRVNMAQVESARLRLNLIPSSRGLASSLPKVSRFGVCGLVDRSEEWQIDGLWEDAPTPDDGVLLGTFEIPRSRERGSFGFQNQTLLDFLKANEGRSVTMILFRQTTQIEGVGPSLTHMFASDSHPEAVGPMLEFSMTE